MLLFRIAKSIHQRRILFLPDRRRPAHSTQLLVSWHVSGIVAWSEPFLCLKSNGVDFMSSVGFRTVELSLCGSR
jgi:hypothetical protein